MLVIMMDEVGGPEVLRPVEVAEPVPGPGEVLVGVEAAGVLTLDTLVRRGAGGPRFAVPLPTVPGRGAGGRVLAVGPSVSAEWVGRAVLADVEGGAYAERLVAPLSAIVPIPEGLAVPDATALLHDGGTALALADDAGIRRGETVLVVPAAGGAGSVLVQLARGAGARVIGVARGAAKGELVRSLGADVVVDSAEPGWAEGLGPVDLVFDGVGGATGARALGLVRSGGRYSNYGAAGGAPTAPPTAAGIDVRGMEQLAGFAAGRRARQERVLAEAAAGRLRAVIGGTFPLAEAAAAHRALESREIGGKALLLPTQA